jgi:hypothetical protein
MRAMDITQFRGIMGLIGQNENPYLADRIYKCFDKDGDGWINF